MAQNFLNFTTHSVSWFAKRNADKELELSAPFQRNPVWSEKQKGYLIDTILNGFPIPELYMQEFTNAQGNERFIVVDGQQRLRACLEFLDGRFALDPVDSPQFADMYFNDLSDNQRKQIFNYDFVIRKLPDMPETEIRAMFQRLNRNVVALNAQELRHATYWGEFISCVETLASDDRWSFCRVFTPNDIRRMIDIEFISEMAVAFLHGLQNKKDTLEDWYQAYENEFPRRSEVESVISSALGELIAILPDIGKTRWRKKSDFYSLFLFFARHNTLFPFSRDGRRLLQDRIMQFGEMVDCFLGDPGAKDIPDSVKKYANAVERAASDLNNRKNREITISEFLIDVIEAEEKARA